MGGSDSVLNEYLSDRHSGRREASEPGIIPTAVVLDSGLALAALPE